MCQAETGWSFPRTSVQISSDLLMSCRACAYSFLLRWIMPSRVISSASDRRFCLLPTEAIGCLGEDCPAEADTSDGSPATRVMMTYGNALIMMVSFPFPKKALEMEHGSFSGPVRSAGG